MAPSEDMYQDDSQRSENPAGRRRKTVDDLFSDMDAGAPRRQGAPEGDAWTVINKEVNDDSRINVSFDSDGVPVQRGGDYGYPQRGRFERQPRQDGGYRDQDRPQGGYGGYDDRQPRYRQDRPQNDYDRSRSRDRNWNGGGDWNQPRDRFSGDRRDRRQDFDGPRNDREGWSIRPNYNGQNRYDSRPPRFQNNPRDRYDQPRNNDRQWRNDRDGRQNQYRDRYDDRRQNFDSRRGNSRPSYNAGIDRGYDSRSGRKDRRPNQNQSGNRGRRDFNDFYGEDARRRSKRGGRFVDALIPTIGVRGKHGEPISLAEELAARHAADPGLAAESTLGKDENKPAEIVELEKKETSDLIAEARKLDPASDEDARRLELIMRVVRLKIQEKTEMYGEGSLEILPNEFGFLRSRNVRYQSSPDDIYVSPSQIRKFGLRTGMTVSGQIRPPKAKEHYFALLRVDSINWQAPEDLKIGPWFDDLVVGRPSERLLIAPEGAESTGDSATDALFEKIEKSAPVGFGQRALIECESSDGADGLTEALVRRIYSANPGVKIVALTLGRSPEELKKLENSFEFPNIEVLGAETDDEPGRYIQASEIAVEKAKRMVEFGENVVLIFDSVTRLTRAFFDEPFWRKEEPEAKPTAPCHQRAKKLFSLARKIADGGSLTIFALARLDENKEGEKLFDESVLAEFSQIADVEIRLDAKDGGFELDPARSLSRDARNIMSDAEYAAHVEQRDSASEKTAGSAKAAGKRSAKK